MSSETRYRFLEPIRQAGAVGLLHKPFSETSLIQAMRTMLQLVDPDSLNEGIVLEDMQVLIADDSRFARACIRKVLAGIGFENFTEVNDGKQAVGALQNGFFDLVVTDFHMPEMDGQALIQHIRTESTQSSVPVVMVSSESDGSRLAGVRQAGADAIMDKPFSPEEVKKMLAQIFNPDANLPDANLPDANLPDGHMASAHSETTSDGGHGDEAA